MRPGRRPPRRLPRPGVTISLLTAVEVQARALGRWNRLPPWCRALLVFAACQLVTMVLLERAGRFTVLDAEGHTGPRSYLSFVARWDSGWYRQIAQDGYPAVLPLDSSGEVAQNPWAFYPLFPMLARALMILPGVGWPVAGWLVAVSCSLVAAVLLFWLVDRLAGPSLALWSVALLGSFTSAPVLQFPYSESLGLALLLAVLCCLHRGWYPLVAPLLVLVGLARPIALPLVVVVAVHAVRRLRHRPSVALSLITSAGVAVVIWPLLAAMRTGRLSAYTDTMAAWRHGRGIVPLDPWFQASSHYLGPATGRVLLIVASIGVLWWLTRPAARLLGADLRVWCVAYGSYLLALVDPTTSLARYLLLLFPLGVLLAAASPVPAYRRSLVISGFVTQIVWIITIWRLGSSPP